jgi:hypothetical protein
MVTGKITGAGRGSDGISIDHLGNVGIGTTGPTSNLHIIGATNGLVGSIKLAGNKTGWGNITSQFATTAGGSIALDNLTISVDSGYIALSPGGGTAMTLLNSGKVGIGTTGPGYKLEVVGSQSLLSSDGTGQLLFTPATTYNSHIISANNYYGGIKLQGGTQAGTANIELGYSGNIIIKGKADEYGDITIAAGNSSGANIFMQAGGANRLYVDYGGNIGIGTITPGTAGLAIMNGNVGIGTTAPGAKLEVADTLGGILISGNEYGGTLTSKSGGTAGHLYLSPQDGTVTIHHASGIANESYLEMYGNSAIRNRLATTGDSYITGGNVGIGTVAPTEKLSVSGNVTFTGSAFVTGTMTIRVGSSNYTFDSSTGTFHI